MRHSVSRKTTGRVVRRGNKSPRNRRKPDYRLLFALFAISFFVSVGASFALRTPDLAVKEAKIDGVCLADKAAVKKAAKSALGENILLLKKSPIMARIRSLSEVADVKMGRSLPDKVWIRVRERTPDAVLTDNRKYCLVQGDGFMFHIVAGPIKGIPVLRVTSCDKICPGRTACSADVRCALEVLRCARKRRLHLDKISIDPAGDICLNMGSGFYVKLGQPDDIPKKMSLLRSALVYRPSLMSEAVYIDLSCPRAPVWKPKSAS